MTGGVLDGVERRQQGQRARLVQVVDAFLHGRMEYAANLMSHGTTLESCGRCIATRIGTRVLLVGKRAGASSRTIRRHKTLLRDMAITQGIEVTEV